MHTAMQEFSRNSFEVRDRQAGAGQTHQENATPSTFRKLKPTSVAAGQALHRGISEMLDRALAERRAQGLDVAVRQRELDAQIAELRTLEDRLDGIRQSLWSPSVESEGSIGPA